MTSKTGLRSHLRPTRSATRVVHRGMDTVGYARIFTTSQHLDMQLDALKAAGCAHIRTDTTSGTLAARPGLDGCALAEPEEDDTLVVWRLDRLGRSLPHLVNHREPHPARHQSTQSRACSSRQTVLP